MILSPTHGASGVHRLDHPPRILAPDRRQIGRRILDRIEAEARAERLTCLRLETGIHQPEALALYRSAGYAERGAFGAYAPDPLSVFMEKIL